MRRASAPDAMYVMRDADVEPAEPTVDVVQGASVTASVPSSVRATWRMTSSTPCPTSAAAQCTTALPSAASCTRAAQKSSNPSEKQMFLKPTANPTPRRTPSPRVVLPAPPGSRIGSRGSSSGSGNGQRRRAADHLGHRQRPGDLLAGRQPVTRPHRVQEPQLDRVDVERLRQPVHLRLAREAGLHRAEPAHRTARRVVRVDGGRLDQRVLDAVRPDGEGGGVGAHGGRAGRVRAAVEQDPHVDGDEPALPGRPMLRPDPRRVTVDVTDEGLLAVVDHLHRPVGVKRQHRAWIWIERSSRPPNAPPTPPRWIRTCSGSSPRHGATWSRSTCSHCVAT